MDLTLTCHHCQKTIDKDGEIHDGKAYHGSCWNESEYNRENDDLEDLYKAFPGVAPDILDDLYECGDATDKLTEDLNSNWCVITDNPRDEVHADAFKTKKAMLDWITEQIYTLMLESYSWDIVYILHKGQVTVRNGEIKIKVST